MTELWLRPGKYEILARDVANQPRHRQQIVVGAGDKTP